MKQTLETLADAKDGYDRLAGWCAAIGLMITGGFFFFASEKFAQEIPHHKLIGAGVFAIGFVFVIALAARGQAASRAKNFLLFAAAGSIAGGLGYGAWKEGRIVYGLHAHGEEVTLPVIACNLKFIPDGENYWQVILSDQERHVSLEWDEKIRVGTTMSVLVHPDHGGWTAATPEGSTLIEIADARETRWSIIGMAAISLLVGLFALGFLSSFLSGSPAPDEAID